MKRPGGVTALVVIVQFRLQSFRMVYEQDR
jgi:hypothetical protein